MLTRFTVPRVLGNLMIMLYVTADWYAYFLVLMCNIYIDITKMWEYIFSRDKTTTGQ